MRLTSTVGSVLLAAATLGSPAAHADGPATQPTAVSAEQLKAVLPAAFANMPQKSADAIPDSGMSTPAATAHYKVPDSKTEFGDVTLTDYGGSDLALTMVDRSAGIGKNYTDTVATFTTTTVAGYPAEVCTPNAGGAGYVNVVVAKRFIVAFRGSLTMNAAALKAAAAAYDFKPLAALAK